MGYIFLKKAKTIVYLPSNVYGKFVNQYAKKNQWTGADKIDFLIAGTKRNKEKKRVHNFIYDSMINEWEYDKKDFREKYSFVYYANAIEEHLYELIWAFCEFNPRYQMLAITSDKVIRPTHVNSDLSVTYGKDFYVGECRGLRRKIIAESQYRIKTNTITLLYGDMMDFKIGFKNGMEYRFQTLFDGRKTSGSISIDIGDSQKWNVLLQKAEEEHLAQEKANAPKRYISTEEFQKTSLAYAQNAYEKYYKEILDIELSYEHASMTTNIDFLTYVQKWSNLHKQSKIKHDELEEFDALWRQQPSKSLSMSDHLYTVMLNETSSLYFQLYIYCDEMAQMMHHLHDKAQGRRYSKKDYQNELKRTELRRSIIEHDCLDIKKRCQDLIDNKWTSKVES